MTNDQLLQEIQTKKLLPDDLVEKVRHDAAVAGASVEAIVFEKKMLDDAVVAQLKSRILNIPYKKLDVAKLDAALLAAVPEETVRTYQVAPMARQGNTLVAGMVNPDDIRAQDALKFISHRDHVNLGIFLISYGDWQAVVRRYSPYSNEVQRALSAIKGTGAEGRARERVRLDEVRGREEEAPIIRIVAETLQEAVSRGASDIHMEPQESYLRVRFRLDGELKEVTALPLELSAPIVSRVKILSDLKIDETRIPQDGRFRSAVGGRDIDFRVSTFPTPMGEKAAIRVLDPSTGLKNFESLGLEGRNREVVEESMNRAYGMILVSGPTGSGKTTTLYSLLERLNRENLNIVSLEDPVEYFISGINQSQVRPEIGYDFASGLRQILRQDPDVIMVGEIRDSETAGLAINAALTGHVVLSTLHTNNTAGIIPRLIDMKVEPFLLPSSLNLMVAQRLVAKLCDKCREAADPPPAVREIIKKELAGVDTIPQGVAEPYKIFHSKGCPACGGRGIVGRIALFEILHMTGGLEEIVNTGATVGRIAAEAKKQGVLTMRQDGILKALRGTVSIEEVLKETEGV